MSYIKYNYCKCANTYSDAKNPPIFHKHTVSREDDPIKYSKRMLIGDNDIFSAEERSDLKLIITVWIDILQIRRYTFELRRGELAFLMLMALLLLIDIFSYLSLFLKPDIIYSL